MLEVSDSAIFISKNIRFDESQFPFKDFEIPVNKQVSSPPIVTDFQGTYTHEIRTNGSSGLVENDYGWSSTLEYLSNRNLYHIIGASVENRW